MTRITILVAGAKSLLCLETSVAALSQGELAPALPAWPRRGGCYEARVLRLRRLWGVMEEGEARPVISYHCIFRFLA